MSNEFLEQLESMKELQEEKQSIPVIHNNDEVVPLHIGLALSEIDEKVNDIQNLEEKARVLKEEVKILNEITPNWFWVFPKIEKNAKGEVKKVGYTHGFTHEKMGDYLIRKYHLVRYPRLREGAVYNSTRGYWRYFGKGEMKDFCEKETLSILQKWGYYDIKHIPPVRIYVNQKTYDESYPSATPFEISKPELVVFRNGTYNMLTDTMKENDPKDFILNSHNYDLDMSGSKTPHTDALLKGLMGDNVLFVKQFIGYMFYRSHTPAQEMLFFKGNGGEGKSTFIAYLSNHILGSDNVSAVTPQDLSNDRFQVVELLGKSANICADVLDDYIEDSSILKRLTGGDPVTAQFKGIQGFKMINYSKLIFSANRLPKFKDHTKGFSDRLAVVPFINGNQRKPEANFWKNHDMSKVEKEAPSFAYNCIREFMKIFDGKKATFTKTETMENEKAKWLLDNDHIAEFVLEATEIDLQDDRGEMTTKVHGEYKAFCKKNNYSSKSPQAMRDYLESLGVVKAKSRLGYEDGGSPQWRYIGLRLIATFIDEFDIL